LRLAGALVEEVATKLVQACGWKGRSGSDGRESVSLPIGSLWFVWVPVTTSWLQISGRDVFPSSGLMGASVFSRDDGG
jgi:hypothetical protein